MSWEMVKLDDCLEWITYGFTNPMPDADNGPWKVTAKDIIDGRINFDSARHTTQEAYEKDLTDKSRPIKDDLLLTKDGTLGRVALVGEETICINQSVALLRLKKDIIAPEYLLYLLQSSEYQGKMLADAGGSTIKHIYITKVNQMQIPLPPPETQRKLVDILQAYDKILDINQKQIKLLEEAAQRLYKEWFVDLRFPGYENTPITNGIPQGWSKDFVGNVIDKSYRSKQVMTADYLAEGKFPIIDQSRDFIAGYTDDEETLVSLDKPIIVFGDHTRVLKYIQFPFAKGADGTQLILSDCESLPQSLLYLSLLNVDLSNYHYARHFKYLKAEEIIIPNVEIATKFDFLVTPIFKKVQILRDQIINAQQARDRLLPKLMSGELEV
ncbi:MAG: restriction endonuclease subunit S [Clostridia bacterium]|nr:restriction endonuclease subunit S [Clostridia bacterium]